MEIQWLGTAGFKIRTENATFLIDPYLSRNPAARPSQPLGPADLKGASHIFVSHGHFDHILDIPAIASQTGATVVSSPEAANTLHGMGLDPEQTQIVENEGFSIAFDGVKATAFYSRHVRFDLRLLFTTLVRMGRRIPEILSFSSKFPCGQVLCWKFELENKQILFFGSGGSTKEELEHLARAHVDILLVPLQGHTHICDKALFYLKILKPDLVIPHHQDDFFPPLSQTVDISPFVDRAASVSPETQVRLIRMNETLTA